MVERSVIILLCLTLAGGAPAGLASDNQLRVYEWAADAAHSSIEFRTSHWGIVDIIGWFEEFEISVRTLEDDFSTAEITARIKLASVRMPNQGMAGNVRKIFSGLDAAEARFDSTSIERKGEREYRILGNMKIGSVTKPVAWKVRFHGFGGPPSGSPGFTATMDLSRLDYGIGDEQKNPGNGEPVVGLMVEVTCNIRLEYIRG